MSRPARMEDFLGDDHIACVEAEGTIGHGGYKLRGMTVGRGKSVNLRAHVIAFEAAWGKVPAGMIVRHVCDNPACANPLHLQLGTLGDNNRDTAERRRHSSQQRTHCPAGHELAGDNLSPSRLARSGWRQCLACHRERQRALRAARRLAS